MNPEKLIRLRRKSAAVRALESTGQGGWSSTPALGPCGHEGPILEWCNTCNGEMKHVRECDLYDKCTRGYVSDKVRSCDRCESHTARQTVKELPVMAVEESPRGVKWAYGVTTVPGRRDDLLRHTLMSLGEAGFDKPRLFVDGCDDPRSWEREFGLEVTARHPRIRTFGNWVLGLAELYIREPARDRYAMFQDDLVTYKNLRAYLESLPFPEKAYWNLYTFPSNQKLCPSGHSGWYRSNQLGRGAVALVFSREGVKTLLQSRGNIIDRPEDVHRGHRAVDGGIVEAMRKAGYTELVHSPSLTQHTGDHSSMGNRPHKKASSFRGETYDAKEMIGKTGLVAA